VDEKAYFNPLDGFDRDFFVEFSGSGIVLQEEAFINPE